LKSITLPKKLKTVESTVFSSCENLTDVYYGGGEDDWKNIDIDDSNKFLINASIRYNSAAPEKNNDEISDTEKLSDNISQTSTVSSNSPNNLMILFIIISVIVLGAIIVVAVAVVKKNF